MIEGGSFWMGVDNFYAFDGAIKNFKVSCSQSEYSTALTKHKEKKYSVQRSLSSMKYGGSIHQQVQTEVDKYVIYNYIDQHMV